MAVSNESLALTLLVDATADTARGAGQGILDARTAELRRQQAAVEAEQRRQAEAAAAAAAARRSRLVHLASGALTGVVVGIAINMILNTKQSIGKTLGEALGISGAWAVIILLVTVGIGLAFAAHDHSDALDFAETVVLAGTWGGLLTGICVVFGVLVSEIRDDDNVVEKIIVLILNGGLGGIAGVIAGAISFGAAGIVYATIRRIASALVRTS